MGCRVHTYIITEVEGDGAGSWRAHALMCVNCLHLLPYKDVLKLNKAKLVDEEQIINI